MLAMVGMVLGPALLSRAQVCLAPSSWRRLLMQAVCLALALARMKLGMAIVASSPMMATTIMISTSVKPGLRYVFIFIGIDFFELPAGQTEQADNLQIRINIYKLFGEPVKQV